MASTRLAAASGAPVVARPIALCVPHVEAAELENVAQCLASNLLVHGPFVAAFERGVAAYVGAPHGVATSSGTTALHIALQLAGVQAGEEVLVTTLTFIAPANAVRYVGAHPVFVGVDSDTWQIDPTFVEAFLREECRPTPEGMVNRSTGRRVSALIAVHLLGHPADMDALLALGETYGLTVIEDAAQALGVRYKGRRVGAMARIGCFSFYGNKVITAAGGGMIVTADERLARRARYLINQAKDDAVRTSHNEVGYNYRMTNLQGAIGCAQLDRIEAHIAAKRRIANAYATLLRDVAGVAVTTEPVGSFSTFSLSTIVVNDALFGLTADQLRARLAERAIESLPLAQPLHLSAAHAGAQSFRCESAEGIVERVLSLPSSVGLAEPDQLRVISAIREAGAAARGQS